MKLQFRFAMLLAAASILIGCHKQPAITRYLLAGNYKFVSNDPASRAADHISDQLVLQSDGTYDLVEGGATKAVTEKRGLWKIVPGNPTNVLLDHDGYPVEIKRHEIRLLVNQDTGVWWTKSR